MANKKNMQIRTEIVAFIKLFTQENGYPPSLRDVAQYFNLGTSTAKWFLDEMRNEGMITFEVNTARTYRVINNEVTLPKLENIEPVNMKEYLCNTEYGQPYVLLWAGGWYILNPFGPDIEFLGEVYHALPLGAIDIKPL